MGRNGWSSRRSRRSWRRSSPGMGISNCRTGASALSGSDMIPHPDPDGDRAGRGVEAEGARSWGEGRRAHPLFVVAPAEMGSVDEEPRRSCAGSLSARRFHWRLSGRPDGLARQGCAQSFAFGDRAAEERLGGRPSALASQRSSARRLCLCLGAASICRRAWSRRPNAFSYGLARPRRAKRSFWACRRACGKAAELEGTACRSKGAGSVDRAGHRGGRWGALGFWKALDEAFPSTGHQRCWRRKTLNVLDQPPKSVQPNAHRDQREIWLSEIALPPTPR